MRLAVLSSHPVQYYGPLFRKLAEMVELHVFFAHNATASQQAAAGFGRAFEWDIDLVSGYQHSFLKNVARQPTTARFAGCDTPEISDRLTQGGFTHVLSFGWHLKSLIQGMWAAKRQGLAVMVRGDSQLGTPRSHAKRLVKRFVYPKLLSGIDAALYVGVKNRAYYECYGVRQSRLFHSPHAVETERFSAGATPEARAALRTALGVGADSKLILFAGKLVEFKRPLDTLAMVALLRRGGMNAQLLVAGSGPLEEELRTQALASAVPLHFLGFQNQSQMPAVYAASDVLCLPSTARETWGLVANEALASGRPIVVSDAVGCAPDLAADGTAGRTFPMGNIGAGAEALGAVLAKQAAAASIAAISDRHSLSAAANGILAAGEATTR